MYTTYLIKHFNVSTEKTVKSPANETTNSIWLFFSSCGFDHFYFSVFCRSKDGKKYEITFLEFLGLGEKKTHSTSFLNFLAHISEKQKKKSRMEKPQINERAEP